MGHHVYCINRALDPEIIGEGPALSIFTELGTMILENTCPWVTLALYGTLLTPLNKKATGNDARPVSAEDRDCATWHKAAQRALNSAVRDMVTPQQLAVAVSGGVEVKVWGLRLLQEEAERKGCSFTILKEDRVNAHNAFFRKEAVAVVREAAAVDSRLKPFARLTDCILRLQPQIFTRTVKNSTGLRALCTSQRGGAQGNATTNSIYPAAMNKALKNVERTCNVVVRAIQDDTTIAGETALIFGPEKARDLLNSSFAACGNETHPDKSVAFCILPGDRDQVPADVSQPFFIITDSATGIETQVFGVEICDPPLEKWSSDENGSA